MSSPEQPPEKSGRLRKVLIAAGLFALLIAAGNARLSAVVFDDLPGPPMPPETNPEGLASLSAAHCGSCHVEIAREHAGTMHAQAQIDPLFIAERAAQGEVYVCAYCHTPLVRQRPEIVEGLWAVWPRVVTRGRANPTYDAALEAEGVTCAACHLRDGAMVAGLLIEDGLHATRQDKNFGSGRLCRPCHHLDLQFNTHLDRPIQDTFGEWEQYRAKGGDKTCVDCHMPAIADRPLALDRAPRPSHSHALRTPRDVDFLRTGIVVLGVEIDPVGKATVTLRNGSGHRIPTAEPERRVEVVLEALGEGDAPLIRDVEIIQRKVDLAAMRDLWDTSLLPRETRTLALDLNGALPAGTRALRVAVRYYLWEPTAPVVTRAGLSPEALVRVVFEKRLDVH